jgi:hypothetical protein
MKVRLLDIAQQELDEAVEYYNSELPELGEAESVHKHTGFSALPRRSAERLAFPT